MSMTLRRTLTATALLMAGLSCAGAQDVSKDPVQPPVAAPPEQVQTDQRPNAAPTSSGRFSFTKVENGFLRLDSVSGQVSLCSQRAVGWACQAVPEDRAALDSEIARLQGEVTALKDRLAAYQPPAPPRPPGDLVPPSAEGDSALKFPTREEVERARSAIERAWRHLVDMISDFQKDVMRKG